MLLFLRVVTVSDGQTFQTIHSDLLAPTVSLYSYHNSKIVHFYHILSIIINLERIHRSHRSARPSLHNRAILSLTHEIFYVSITSALDARHYNEVDPSIKWLLCPRDRRQ